MTILTNQLHLLALCFYLISSRNDVFSVLHGRCHFETQRVLGSSISSTLAHSHPTVNSGADFDSCSSNRKIVTFTEYHIFNKFVWHLTDFKMFIKEVVIDGFKSYAQRTEIKGFDPLFNAITGLNGSGKSNILDSICFLLGISNLTQVTLHKYTTSCTLQIQVHYIHWTKCL